MSRGGARLRHVARSALEVEVQARRLATWISICSGTYEAILNECPAGDFDYDVACRVRGMLDRLCGSVFVFGVTNAPAEMTCSGIGGAKRALTLEQQLTGASENPKECSSLFYSIPFHPYDNPHSKFTSQYNVQPARLQACIR